VQEEDHDEVNTSRDHANPGNGSPIVKAIAKTENNQHSKEDKERLKSSQAAA